MWVTAGDRRILRDAAREAAEIGHHPLNAERAELWRRHIRLDPVRPMVLCQLAWHLAPFDLQAESDYARAQELRLRMRRFLWETDTDVVFEPRIYAPVMLRGNTFSIQARAIDPDTRDYRGASRYEPVLEGTEDPTLLTLPRVEIDTESTNREYERLSELFEGILEVEKRGPGSHRFEVTNEFVSKWRGMDNFYLDVYERPQWIHAWMRRLVDWWNSLYDQLESLGVLSLNRRAAVSVAAPGGYVWTDELPRADFDGTHVRTCDQWGDTDSEVMGGMVSRAMHEEFALAYDRQVLSRFGLTGYGCCEPLHDRIDLLRRIPNLRRVSISAWADVEKAAEAMGRDLVFSYKPNPAIFSGKTWDPARARRELQDVLDVARAHGCVVEVIMKDIQNYHDEPTRLKEWSAMAMQAVGAGS